MNLLEIDTRARNILDELDIDNSHLTPERTTRFANEGADDLVMRIPAPSLPKLWVPQTLHLQSGVNSYTIPDGWCRTIELFLYGHLATPIPLRMREAFSKNSFYVATTTNPYFIEPYRSNYTLILPTPGQLVENGFDRTYLRMPTAMVNDFDVPELPDIVHPAIVDFVVYRALSEDGDPRAADYYKSYMDKIGGKNGS